MIKLNVDAALFLENGLYSVACIARNDSGEFMEAITSCKMGQITPELAEVFGIREALSWIKRKGWRNVSLETDCLLVV